MARDSHTTCTIGGRTVTLRRAAFDEIVALRHAELRPGLPRATAEFAGDADPTTRHFGAFASGETLVCASFMAAPYAGEPGYQLRGMATRADLVRHGLGGALLRHAVAALAGMDTVRTRLFWCNARAAAVPFYERMGWRIASAVFDVPRIGPHYVMTARCDAPTP
jgi:GNAT superfamily N-acetyltransferase